MEANIPIITIPITTAPIPGRRGQITIEHLVKFQKRGWTDLQIGKYFGISRQAIFQFRRKYNIAKTKNRFKDRDDLIFELYFNHELTGIKIARTEGVRISQTQAYRIIRRLKKERFGG